MACLHNLLKTTISGNAWYTHSFNTGYWCFDTTVLNIAANNNQRRGAVLDAREVMHVGVVQSRVECGNFRR